jgi:hypothetical protein
MNNFVVFKLEKDFVCSCKRQVNKDHFVMIYDKVVYCPICALALINIKCLGVNYE